MFYKFWGSKNVRSSFTTKRGIETDWWIIYASYYMERTDFQNMEGWVDGYMEGWKDTHTHIYIDIHINIWIYNMYIIYRFSWHRLTYQYIWVVLFPYIHAYETLHWVQDNSGLWVTSPFALNGLKTTTTTTKQQNAMYLLKQIIVNYYILNIPWHSLYLLAPKELYEKKNPTDKYNSCKQQYFPFKQF